MTTRVPAALLDFAVPVPALELIQVHTFSGALTYEVENFSSTYDDYLLIVQFAPASTGAASMRFKVGGSYLTTSTYRSHASRLASNAASSAYTNWATSALPYIALSAATSCSSAATSKNSFVIQATDVNAAGKYPSVMWQGSFTDGTHLYLTNGAADIPTAGALQGIQFMVNDGSAINVGGTVKVYGYQRV